MTKFEIWRQRRREQSAVEAAPPPVEALRAEREALAADASTKRTKADAEPEQEDTVPAAFYRNVG